ncbi:MAG TPA: type VI secretion system baseplate subunit TssG [Burkholderiaceae bacterium]|nr:type VI secretion system baseplate subunit TssG [Burkholderiaceae bacterium]
MTPGATDATEREAFWRTVAEAPFRHDFYALLRRIENLWRERPRLGRALRPADEPVRVAQDPEMDFAPAPVSSLRKAERAVAPRLGVRMFGLFGPNGALPLHLTELARSRERQHGDASLRAFVDIFHHRMLLLFYRGWAQAQPAVELDRREDARIDAIVGALGGLAPAAARKRDAIGDDTKRQHIALLARGVRTAEGLADSLAQILGVPVWLETFVGHWLPLRPEDRTRLGFGGAACQIGVGAVAGERVWDRQSKFRLHIGPVSAEQYRRFVPGGTAVRALRDWVRQYVGFDLVWDIRVALAASDVQGCRLGADAPLGYAAWLGAPHDRVARDDLVFAPEERGLGGGPANV